MAKRKILTIGLGLASDDCEFADFKSKTSLLDWDLAVFRFEIGEHFYLRRESYRGKPTLDDEDSFQLKDYCSHWRKEIKQAVEAGKTVLVYLPPLQEVYVDTGERTYTGTGKNRRPIRHVDIHNNYAAIPAALTPVASSGSQIKLAPKGVEALAPYWQEFGDISNYEVLIEDSDGHVCLMTKSGDKPVGLLFRSRGNHGAMLLLPDINFCPDDFVGEDEDWTPIAQQFAARYIKSIVALDKALKSSDESTPEPDWATGPTYALPAEKPLKESLLKIEQRLETALREKDNALAELDKAGSLRALLYEKGKPLERAIIEALKILGFSAEPFQNSDSEFDVVFESPEGRLIGEAEGKDNKAVNVEKLRQLSMNIHEDLLRDDVHAPAKGVLFGNPFRLAPPSERAAPFTAKCETAAKSSSTALVPTPVLFELARALLAKKNAAFAKKCRKAIINASGEVAFPPLPARPTPPTEGITEE